MRATIWGCRGSLPAPGASRLRYGGDTSCVELRLSDGTLIVLDAGTGIRELGTQLGAEREVHLLLTHLHMDHVEGFPFFSLLWTPDANVHIWGPPSPMLSLKERLARYMSPPLFPIDVHDVPCSTTFHDLPTEEWTIGSATVLAQPIEHPGPTVGFRVTENGRTFAYMPDHEPAALGDFRNESPDWIDGFAIAEGADLLMHDCQYTAEEYADRRGWGHSSFADAVAYAEVTGAKQLLMFHHDPTHDDEQLETIERAAREIWSSNGTSPKLAATGMSIDLTTAAASVLS
ncbi:MAG: MBL fold metallo-hydrolase [Actinomycetota bacterium]